MASRLRLGVNIDHVATVRNARGGARPDTLRAAQLAIEAGADGITAHLREDRRHIRDEDIVRLKETISKPLNLEMAATEQMLDIALRIRPHACCLVPEKRTERTTEGGLDVVGGHNTLKPFVSELARAGIRVSLFIEPSPEALEASASLGAPVVELHAGAWCDAVERGEAGRAGHEFERLARAAKHSATARLECHAGHGLDFDTARAIAALPEIVELNIGHFLVGEAIFVGLAESVRLMRAAMDAGRGGGAVIVGIGSDLCDIRRIAETLERFGDRFVRRCFTDLERRRSDRRAQRAASYAKRFAAKEACAKALGTGLRDGVFWRDMGVVNLASGQPTLRLTGGAAARLALITPAGMTSVIHLTMTDEDPLAQAFVVIEARKIAGAAEPGP